MLRIFFRSFPMPSSSGKGFLRIMFAWRGPSAASEAVLGGADGAGELGCRADNVFGTTVTSGVFRSIPSA